jgi:hypothetical protein
MKEVEGGHHDSFLIEICLLFGYVGFATLFLFCHQLFLVISKHISCFREQNSFQVTVEVRE